MFRIVLSVFMVALLSSVVASPEVDAWFEGFGNHRAYSLAPCPDGSEAARSCAEVVTSDSILALNALAFTSPPGHRAVGEGSLRRVQVPDQCAGFDEHVVRPGCRLMFEFTGAHTIVLVLDGDYLLMFRDDPVIEAQLERAKADRDARFEADDAVRVARLTEERRANLAHLSTPEKVRAMTRDLLQSLNYGERACDVASASANLSLCGQTHGDVEVFEQFTETRLLLSRYFDGQIVGTWTRSGSTTTLPLQIDGRDVRIVFEGEQGPFENFGVIRIELHD